jgi:hypothetical protein
LPSAIEVFVRLEVFDSEKADGKSVVRLILWNIEHAYVFFDGCEGLA